jgi:hypothetical protein
MVTRLVVLLSALLISACATTVPQQVRVEPAAVVTAEEKVPDQIAEPVHTPPTVASVQTEPQPVTEEPKVIPVPMPVPPPTKPPRKLTTVKTQKAPPPAKTVKKSVAVAVVVPAQSPPPPTVTAKPPPASLPAGAVKNLPLLVEQIQRKWPDMLRPSFLAAQIEQETCISLSSSKCWTSRAELHTKYEWCVSFGQFTIAYDKYGKERFNAFEDVKKLDRELLQWNFADRYNERFGMIAFVVRMLSEFNWVTGAKDFVNQHAFSVSAYNGGRGGVLQDRRLCAATKGCDPNVWYGNVERTSYKSKVAKAGYGQSFFQVNRGYVNNVQNVRSHKYDLYFKEIFGRS